MELTEALRRIEDLIAEKEALSVRCEQYRAALHEIYSTGDLPGPVIETLLRAG